MTDEAELNTTITFIEKRKRVFGEEYRTMKPLQNDALNEGNKLLQEDPCYEIPKKKQKILLEKELLEKAIVHAVPTRTYRKSVSFLLNMTDVPSLEELNIKPAL